MPTPSIPALFVQSGLVDDTSRVKPVPPIETVEAQLRAINHRFVDRAIDPSGRLMEALTHEDFLLTQSDGAWCPRADFVAPRHRPLQPVEAAIEDMRVRLIGSVALVHGVLAAPREAGPAERLRYTDVHVWSGTSWRLVSAQETRLAPSVAVPMSTGVAPGHAPWRGRDPSGDDDTTLHALNDHYVQAFREADVAWYDAHLAPDYLVVSGDGSMQDRAAALAHFAEPTFATSIRSFPVGRVKVRRFGDVALIHAENDYELKDGRRGVSRYTDIWHRQDDRWLCMAAHITVHQAPAKRAPPCRSVGQA